MVGNFGRARGGGAAAETPNSGFHFRMQAKQEKFKVAVRLRPMNQKERDREDASIIQVLGERQLVFNPVAKD